jgi:Family of unknown function (DUF6049)
MRWAMVCLCALGVASGLLATGAPASAVARREAVTAGTGSSGPSLTLRAQTPWVTPAAPWFSLTVGAGPGTGSVNDLHVVVTYYNRINNETELNQAINAVPNQAILGHFSASVAITGTGRVAATCTTVLPDSAARAPTTVPPTSVACPAGAPSLILGCTPDDGTCGGIYPVSVALYRQGVTAALARYTTFLTYQEPGLSSSVGTGGALRVGLIMPLSAPFSPALSSPPKASLTLQEALTGTLFAHRNIPLTLAVNPSTMVSLQADGAKPGQRAKEQLQAMTAPPGDELIDQPYVPIDVAALAGGGLSGEITTQLLRGDSLLRQAGLHPTAGPWVDASSSYTSANATDLGSGLGVVHTDRLVLADDNLEALSPTSLPHLTFAQTFSLSLDHGTRVTAAGADTQLASFFTADPDNPVLAANQLLAALEFIHFENPFELDPRGVIVEPPASWQPSTTFLDTLLGEMSGNPVLEPVTLNQFFNEVPKGGNQEPATRHLQSGSAAEKIPTGQAQRLATARVQLNSLSAAISGHPQVLTELSDLLLATENRGFDQAQRSSALATFGQHFGGELNLVSLASQATITFTSRTAAIPISVLSSAPFPIKVVVSLDSDKFNFPDGKSRTLVLDRPTTPVRIQAHSRTSGDRLPVDVTLTTPDGRLVIARADLTVHSTSISLVGVALTALAAVVLLVWWGRTWRRSRRHRPRAA